MRTHSATQHTVHAENNKQCFFKRLREPNQAAFCKLLNRFRRFDKMPMRMRCSIFGSAEACKRLATFVCAFALLISAPYTQTAAHISKYNCQI